MKPKATEEVTENIEVVTPGVLLQEARISLQLTPNDIASKLNLKAAMIESIEANEFDEMASRTFARGYLKAYAKLVHVSESDVLEAFEYLSTAEQQQLEMQSFSHGSSQRAMDHWLSIFSYLVLFVLIILAVVWWLQRNEPATETVTTPSVVESVVKTPQTQNPKTQNDTSGPTDNEVSGQIDAAETILEQDIPVIDEVATSEQVTEQAEDTAQQVSDSAQQVQDSDNLDQQIAQQLSGSDDETNANLSHLELRFSDSCWINIEDATGERIAIGTKSKGHLTSVYGVAPFTIKLGKPDVVSIWLEGSKKDIPYYPKGSIANFELSLN